ncbi:MAG: hypothetical protein EBR82_35310 [Caulobacteraceae bacterium]|nr:hypothetical protein [Caulobacteraceae bacterium]
MGDEYVDDYDVGGGTYSGSDEYLGGSSDSRDTSYLYDYGVGSDYVGSWGDYASWDWTEPEKVTEIPNASLPGDPAYGWKYFSDGTAIGPDGKYYYKGELAWSPSGGGVLDRLGQGVASALKKAFTDKDGNVDMRAVAGAAGGLYGLYKGMQGQNAQKVGYQGKIPEYTAVRQQVPVAETPAGMQPRRPGEYGRRYFTDVKYLPKTDTEAITAANTAAATQADTLSQAQVPTTPIPKPAATTETQPVDRQTFYNNLMNQTPLASGGIAGLKQGRYLKGGTDGMADKIATSIDGTQPAALSHGEFVIPADVVSHLGNGNSEAGAQRLYSMMDRIRRARTGTAKQGKQINPDKHLPA